VNKDKYQSIVKKYTPKEDRLLNAMIAFFVGGMIGILGQFLIELYSYYLNIPTKEAGVFMTVTLIFVASLLTAMGIFDKLVTSLKAGLIIPITGFAHSMMSSAMEYKKEGLIMGIGSNIFKLSGSVILYGVVSAYVFGLLRFMLFGG